MRRRSMTFWASRRARSGAFLPPVIDPGEIGRAGFSSHFDRRIEIDQGLVETAVGLVEPWMTREAD